MPGVQRQRVDPFKCSLRLQVARAPLTWHLKHAMQRRLKIIYQLGKMDTPVPVGFD